MEEDVAVRSPKFLGLTFQSWQSRNVVRKVLVAAVVMALVQVAIFTWNCVLDHDLSSVEWALVMLVLGLVLPACWYYAVKGNSRLLVCVFCGCSWFQVSAAACSIWFSVVTIWYMQSEVRPHRLCSADCLAPPVEVYQEVGPGGLNLTAESYPAYPVGCTSNWRAKWHEMNKTLISEGKGADAEEICLSTVSLVKASYATAFIVLILCSACAALLAVYTGCHGHTVFTQLSADDAEPLVIQPSVDHGQVSTRLAQPQAEE